MGNPLSSIVIDVGEVLAELRLHWVERSDYGFNPLALTKIKTTGDHLMFCCPHHAQTGAPSCGMMTEYPYGYQCFGCETSGNLAQLVTYVMGFRSELQGIQWLIREFISTSADERPPINIDDILDGREADKKRTLSDSEAAKYTTNRHDYMYRRGFSESAIQRYELGYDEQADAITIPVRNSKGQLRFIKRRSVSKRGFLNETNIYKKDIVYGLCYILNAPRPITEIYLNESETDTVSCYEGRLPAGALMGRLLFEEQVHELVKAGIKTVNLFFDNDIYGVAATLSAYRVISRLSPIRVNVVIYPEGHWGITTTDLNEGMTFKDANDLLKAGRLDSFHCVSYTDYTPMLKLNHEKIVKILGRNKQHGKTTRT